MGDQHIAAAQAALNRSTIFGFGKTQKFEDAAESYKAAGNAYKLNDRYRESGDAYVKASECYETVQGKSSSDYVSMLVEAANSYKRDSGSLAVAIETYAKAIKTYAESGRISQAARYQKEVAEILEQDQNAELAYTAYEKAADLFGKDNKKSAAKDCFVKMATILSTTAIATSETATPQCITQLQKSAELFESIAKDCLDSKLGSYSAKGYFFQATLCLLATGDNVAVEMKLSQFKNLDYSFPSSRECTFLEKLIAAVEANDADAIANACADFDRITPLDPWKTSMLLRAKKLMETAGEADLELC